VTRMKIDQKTIYLLVPNYTSDDQKNINKPKNSQNPQVLCFSVKTITSTTSYSITTKNQHSGLTILTPHLPHQQNSLFFFFFSTLTTASSCYLCIYLALSLSPPSTFSSSSPSSPPLKRAQQSPHKHSFHSSTTRSQQVRKGYPHDVQLFELLQRRRSYRKNIKVCFHREIDICARQGLMSESYVTPDRYERSRERERERERERVQIVSPPHSTKSPKLFPQSNPSPFPLPPFQHPPPPTPKNEESQNNITATKPAMNLPVPFRNSMLA